MWISARSAGAFGVLLLAFGLAFSSCRGQGEGQSDLRLLWTGAVLGFVEPCGCTAGRIGGMDRIAAYVRRELAEHPAALYVDSGDLFARYHRHARDDGGSPYPAQQDPIKAEAFLRTLADLGAAAMGVGDLDLSIGADTLVSLAAKHGVPLVNANVIRADGTPVFPPYRIVERGGRRIGIFSVLADRLRSDEIDDKRPVDVTRILREQGLRLLPWQATAAQVVRELRTGEGVDLVICASHLGARNNLILAREVPGIDAVFGPHADEAAQLVRWVEGTPVLGSAVRGARVGTVDWWWPNPRSYFGAERPGALADVSDDVWLAFERTVHQSDLELLRGRETVLGPEEFEQRRTVAERSLAALERMAAERPKPPAGNRFSAMLVPMHSGMGRDEAALDSIDLYHEELHHHWTADPPQSRFPTERFRGPNACESCHPAQTEFWRGTDHSRAFATLRATQQHVDLECIGCHTVGLHLPGGFRHPAASQGFENVQCAACHGPEGGHLAGGRSYLDESVFRPPLQSCAHCHNKEHDPTFQQEAARKIPLVACPPMDPPGRGPLALRAALLDAARDLESEATPDWPRISDAYHRAGDLTASVAAARRAMELERHEARTHIQLANRLVDAGQWREALEISGRLVRAQPNSGPAWQVHAAALIQSGQREEALRAAQEALSLRPQDLTSAALAARAYVDLGRRLEALDTLRNFQRAYPQWEAEVKALLDALQ